MAPNHRLRPALACDWKARILVYAGLCAALIVLAIPASAQSAKPGALGQASLLDTSGQKTWVYLSGDKLSGHADKEVLLEGNAQMQRSDSQISADRMRYDQRTDRLQAEDHVRIVRKERIYTGSYLDMDVERFEGFFTHISYDLGGEKGHGEAVRADFTDKDHMTAHQGTYTTCRRKPIGCPSGY